MILSEKIDGNYNLTKLSGMQQIIYQLERFLNTQERNYPDDPDYGINLKKYQFKNINDNLKQKISNDLTNKINKYFMNQVILSSINIAEITNGIKINILVIIINDDIREEHVISLYKEDDLK